MVEFNDDMQRPARIQWNESDVEAGDARARPNLHRSNSNISINSAHSRRGSIDPASALPIQYRTVSFQIAESKEKNAAEIKKAKDSAAKGRTPFSPRFYELIDIQNSGILIGTR